MGCCSSRAGAIQPILHDSSINPIDDDDETIFRNDFTNEDQQDLEVTPLLERGDVDTGSEEEIDQDLINRLIAECEESED